jgi:hypothetical protein
MQLCAWLQPCAKLAAMRKPDLPHGCSYGMADSAMPSLTPSMP